MKIYVKVWVGNGESSKDVSGAVIELALSSNARNRTLAGLSFNQALNKLLINT